MQELFKEAHRHLRSHPKAQEDIPGSVVLNSESRDGLFTLHTLGESFPSRDSGEESEERRIVILSQIIKPQTDIRDSSLGSRRESPLRDRMISLRVETGSTGRYRPNTSVLIRPLEALSGFSHKIELELLHQGEITQLGIIRANEVEMQIRRINLKAPDPELSYLIEIKEPLPQLRVIIPPLEKMLERIGWAKMGVDIYNT